MQRHRAAAEELRRKVDAVLMRVGGQAPTDGLTAYTPVPAALLAICSCPSVCLRIQVPQLGVEDQRGLAWQRTSMAAHRSSAWLSLSTCR